MKNGKLIVFSAPSGSGKTTLVNHLLNQDIPLGFSISATSRKPRGKEENGKDYYFLSEDVFRKKITEDAFIEYEEVYKGIFYGTLKSEFNRLWRDGKHVLFDIDVKGGLNIKAQYPEETFAVFVKSPSLKVLEKRLRDRGTESEDKIQQRLDKSTSEFKFSKDFDIILINDDLKRAKDEVVSLVKKFLSS
ncbi:MAG: guanylate kinase [Flavobacteriaceae bacterium]